MRCYNHRENHAIATCRNCGKAACANCCDDTGQGIACSPACSEELRRTYRLKSGLHRNFGIESRPQTPISVFMYAFFGLILLAVGIYVSYTRPGLDYLTLAMSAVFFVMAGTTYKRYRDGCPVC
jgi:hypothetical protein